MPTLTILLVYTKVPRSTKKMVAVKYLYDKVKNNNLEWRPKLLSF